MLKDDESRARRCLELLKRAERNEIRLYTSELVIAELVWVLQSSQYGLEPARICNLLMPIIHLPGLKLTNKKLYSQIFNLYVGKKMDYIDAYHLVLMEKTNLKEIYSYDKDFDGIAGIKRMEP